MSDPKSQAGHKRFRLAFVNAAEDVPRIVRAYGRACFGEFALVMRPADRRAVMVRVTKEGASMWRSTDEIDAPVLPEVSVDANDAVAVVKTEQRAVPKPGPITLRGQWTGHLLCEDGVPRVELVRKLAAYAVLRITSSSTRWYWKVERAEKWFSAAGSASGTATHLIEAIEQALVHAMGLLGEACSTRDSHRRAALDEGYAADHPIRPAKEGADPTERLRPREPRRKAPAEPARMDAPVALPDAPSTPAGVQRMADEVAQEADALAAIRDTSWLWHDSTAVEDALGWFREAGLGDLADDLAAYEVSPDQPPEVLIERLRATVAGEGLDDASRKGAEQAVDQVAAAFRTAPYVLERARRLIRHAGRLAETELCRGKERKEAADAIHRAIHAYDEARSAVTSGATAEARSKVRSMVEWAALAAAKTARACAAGQTTLPAPPARRPATRAEAPGTAVPARKPSRRRPHAEPAVAEEQVAPDPRRKGTTREPSKAARTAEPGARARKGKRKKKVAESEVDADKDKLLLDAFRDAVTAAMSEANGSDLIPTRGDADVP